jgi:hypothetical protein
MGFVLVIQGIAERGGTGIVHDHEMGGFLFAHQLKEGFEKAEERVDVLAFAIQNGPVGKGVVGTENQRKGVQQQYFRGTHP